MYRVFSPNLSIGVFFFFNLTQSNIIQQTILQDKAHHLNFLSIYFDSCPFHGIHSIPSLIGRGLFQYLPVSNFCFQ